MTYEDLELNQFFTKSSTIFQTLPDNEFDAFVDNISANKINRGIAKTANLTVDFDKGLIQRSEGNTLRLEIGKFDDGTYGLKVYSASGDTVVDQTA